MSWPKEGVVRAMDWGGYHSTGWPLYAAKDVAPLLDANPDVGLFILEAGWNSGVPVKQFGSYFDQLTAKGERVAAYLWPNVKKKIADVVEDWRRSLADRKPRLIIIDLERTKENAGVSNAVIGDNFEAAVDMADRLVPGAYIMGYSRANLIDPFLGGRQIVKDLDWWIAYYAALVQDFDTGNMRKAVSFREIEACLPISNNFTPRITTEMSPAKVQGWQVTDILKAQGWGVNVDGGLWKVAFLDRVYGDGPDEPEPPAPPAPAGGTVDVIHDPGVVVTVKERAP